MDNRDAPTPPLATPLLALWREPMTRARFLKTVATAGIMGSVGVQLATVARAEAATTASPAPVTGTASELGHRPLLFFSTADAETITAMAERIFPADAVSPGAADARVTDYIDGQLAGGFGRADRTYLNGPYLTPGDAFHGWQYPVTPRDLYRIGLDALNAYLAAHHQGASFASLPAATQDAVLTAMAAGQIPMQPTSDVFFAVFQANVIEGLFSDPVYGGNRDFIGWEWVRFPGDPMAYGDVYFEYIDKFEVVYNVAPAGLAQTVY